MWRRDKKKRERLGSHARVSLTRIPREKLKCEERE
jgi:hypothetical protein